MPLKTLHEVIDVKIDQWITELSEIRDLIENGQSGIVSFFESRGYMHTELSEYLKLIDLALIKLDAFTVRDGPDG